MRRYKVLVSMQSDQRGQLFSPLPRNLYPSIIGREWDALFEKYHRETVYSDGTRVVSICAGIPVLCTPAAARGYLRELVRRGLYSEYNLVVAEVAVSGLLYRGSTIVNGRRYKKEAWSKMRVVRVLESVLPNDKTLTVGESK